MRIIRYTVSLRWLVGRWFADNVRKLWLNGALQEYNSYH